ncbi:hypothetical protein FDO63_RS09605 [Enterococcus hirae]
MNDFEELSVNIRGTNTYGSGLLYQQDCETGFVITAKHCVVGETINDFKLFDYTQSELEILEPPRCSDSLDLAIIKVKVKKGYPELLIMEPENKQEIVTLTKLFSLLNLDDHQLSQKDYSKEPDYSFLLEQISQLDDIWQERKKLEVDLAQKKKERSSLEVLGSQLEQLKKLGYSIVTDTSSSVCPLCLHDHQEFQHIIQKIEASTADLLPIEQLTKEISHLEGMIDESTRRLTDVVSGVKQQIQIQITIKETEINQLDQNLLQVTLKLKQQEEAYLTNEKHWYKLNEYSQKYGIDCEKIAEETQKRVKSLQEELVKLTNEYQNIKEKINQNEQLNVKNTHTLKTIELHYQQAKKSLNDLKGNEQYQYYQQEQAFYEALGISVISDFKRQCKRELEKINEQETKLIAEKEQRLEQVNGKSKTELVEEQRIQAEQIRQLVVRRKYIEKISYQLFDQVIIAPEELEKISKS